jgi:hypothetical protein
LDLASEIAKLEEAGTPTDTDKESDFLSEKEIEEFGRKLQAQSEAAAKARQVAEPSSVVEPEIITQVVDESGRQVGPELGQPPRLPRRQNWQAPQAIAFPMAERPAATQPTEAPKKSWLPAPLRKWGTRLLMAFGLTAAIPPAAEKMEQLGQAAAQTYADYEKGVRGFAESSPIVREALAREAAEKEKAAALVAGEKVEVGGKTVQAVETGSAQPTVDHDKFVYQDLPRMVEQAKKTLGIESGLPAGYNETNFLNDQETFRHFARYGAGKSITTEVASQALGRMIRYNREKARTVIAQETRDRAAADRAIKEIFG